VAATTARRRRDRPAPVPPREAAPRLGSAGAPAVVFGREEWGLTNDELDLCHLDLTIPTDGDYASLNLGQAVLLVAYELMLARGGPAPRPPAPAANRGELEAMYAHLLTLMLEVGYTDAQRQDHIMRRFRGILDRAGLAPDEVGLLRGLLSQGLWAARRGRGQGEPGPFPGPSPRRPAGEPGLAGLARAGAAGGEPARALDAGGGAWPRPPGAGLGAGRPLPPGAAREGVSPAGHRPRRRALQLYVVRIGGPTFEFWAALLFYGIVGPLATFFVMGWIGGRGARAEKAERDLRELYLDALESHRRRPSSG
jgi:hypothetical protein